MANIDLHFVGKQRTSRRAKWSGRRTIAFALLASGTLWLLIYWIAKALLV